MQIVQVLAGFSLGQADLLRRAMGKKKHEILMAQKENFLKGCASNNIDADLANTIFDLLTHFADYGFNKSHSAAYALVAWQTAYLKAHYPAEFMAAMLTSVMDNAAKVPVYIELAHRMGIKILPPDINASNIMFSVDKGDIRFGLAAVRNVGDAAIKAIMSARQKDGDFKSLLDFCTRLDMGTVNKRVIESLIKCGAFDSLGNKRSQLLSVLDKVTGEAQRRQKDFAHGQLGLFGDFMQDDAADMQLPDVEEVPKLTMLGWEKENTGFYITGHPLDEYKDRIGHLPGIETLQGSVKDKQVVRIAGLITESKRITTKKGDTMCFTTVEDYTEQLEVTIFPRTFLQYMNLLIPDTPVVMQGKVDLRDDEVKLLADKIWPAKEYQPEYYLMPAAEGGEQLLKDLKELMAKHHGDHVVYLYRGSWQKLGEDYWLDNAPETLTELEALLGPKGVKKR